MRRLSITGAAVVMCLALGGTPALAQEAVEEAPARATIITGTVMCDEFTPRIWIETAWGGYERDDAAWCEPATSDPRINSVFLNTYNVDCYGVEPEQAFCIFRGAYVLDGPDGSWDCTWTGSDLPVEETGLLITGICLGTGGYEGLTHVYQHADATSFADGIDYRGAIYEGEPLPFSDVITDPVETVIAGRDAVAGYVVAPAVKFLSGAEVGSDVFTDLREVKGRKAAVDIPAGTPITPDLLEPLPEE
jgi:hypothetical protein